ncbi:putative cytochrome P450 oxidoreductase [Rhexocercosporidium sp. MPI-PUGE-AT-0058]|nr:putative cytochrome P450 oxidoreductase [Rhexocercosporidium sp. MPI-PUGE-AT-0058]
MDALVNLLGVMLQCIKTYPLPVLLILITLNLLYNKYGRGLNHIPGPPLASWTKLWRLQNVSKGQAHRTIIDLHKKYGKLVRTAPNVVDVSDPAMIPVIYNIKGNFKKVGKIFHTAFYTMATFYWNKTPQMNLFSMTDEIAHKEENKKIASAFSMTSLLQLESSIDSCSKSFMQRLNEVAGDGKPVDLGVWLQYYTFDAIGEITFGKKLGFLEQGKDVDRTMKAIDITLTYNAIIGQIPLAHKFLLGIPGLAYILPQVETMNTILNFTLKAIKSRISSQAEGGEIQINDNERGEDMLSRWTSVPASDPLKMDKRDLIAHLSSNVFAGSDTTAIALRAALYHLCKNPVLMAKLVSEIDEAQAKGNLSNPPSYKEASQLPYLHAVIKESLRIHPSVGLLLERHVPKGGAVISGSFLPGNTIVGINAWALHYDEASSEERLREMERSFFAFGAGSRTCTGKNVSLMEMVKIIPYLLREFEVGLVEGEGGGGWRVRNMWFVQQRGLVCVLRPRGKA